VDDIATRNLAQDVHDKTVMGERIMGWIQACIQLHSCRQIVITLNAGDLRSEFRAAVLL